MKQGHLRIKATANSLRTDGVQGGLPLGVKRLVLRLIGLIDQHYAAAGAHLEAVAERGVEGALPQERQGLAVEGIFEALGGDEAAVSHGKERDLLPRKASALMLNPIRSTPLWHILSRFFSLYHLLQISIQITANSTQISALHGWSVFLHSTS